MMEPIVFDPAIAHLEEHVSYGTLGVLNTIVKQSYESKVTKKNIFLVNVGTVVRNCIDKTISDKAIIEKVNFDLTHIRACLAKYDDKTPDSAVFYYHQNLMQAIPEIQRRKETDVRKRVSSIVRSIAVSEGLKPNRLKKITDQDTTSIYGLDVTNGFAYQQFRKLLSSGTRLGNPNRVWMFTHCPIDYFLSDSIPLLEIVESHTGRVFGSKGFAKKVFKKDKEGKIPFNRITYKLFGDKEFVKPLVRNVPKALATLKGVNLRTKTEGEIAQIAKTKLGIDTKLLKWVL